MSRDMFPKLPPEDLERAIQMAETAHGWLQEAYRLVKPHATLSIQCQTAGKAAAHLRTMLKDRAEGVMP